MSLFALVPVEVIQDRRLTLEQMRVLIALLSFRNKAGDTVWPSREAIAERTGMHPANISKATSALVQLGWLEKDGKGGYSKATRYTIKEQSVFHKTVADSATVAERATSPADSAPQQKKTVAEWANKTVADQATRQVADSATRIEQTNEQTSEQTTICACTPLSECPPTLDDVISAFMANDAASVLPDTEAPALFDWYQSTGWLGNGGKEVYSLAELIDKWLEEPEC